MLDRITSSPVVSVLQNAMGAATLRQKVICNNIANVNTPNFKKSEVMFEDLLSQELDDSNSGKLKMARTNEKHLPLKKGLKNVQPVVDQINETSMRTDKNNVDIEIEMANLAKNSIYYNAVATRMGDYFSGMKSVISGQK